MSFSFPSLLVKVNVRHTFVTFFTTGIRALLYIFMVKKRKTFLLFFCTVVAIACTKKTQQKQSKSVQKYKLVFKKDVSVQIPVNLLLDTPINVQFFGTDKILWGEEKRFLLFNTQKENDQNIKIFDSKGRGPGEILSASYYQVDRSGRISTLDYSQAKINVLDSTLNHLFDVPLPDIRLQKFLSLNNDQFATLNLPSYKKLGSAVSIYDKNGEIKQKFGKIPYGAVLQIHRNGGGITKDEDGNIYYSYLGGYKIWKLNPSSGIEKVFSKKPKYFQGISRDKLSEARHNLKKLINYSFKISRVMGLWFMKPNLIIQQIDNGTKKVDHYLEIWNTSGKKLAHLKIPHWVADIHDQNIYTYYNTPSKMIENASNDSLVKLFKIYRIKKNNK